MSQKVSPLSKLKKPQDPFLFYTAPLRYTACVFGVWPVRIKNDRYTFSPLRFIYGAVLILSSSLYRMYLEPSASPGFILQIMRIKNLLVPISFLLFGLVMSVKLKKLSRCLDAVWSMRRFLTLPRLKTTFYWQIILVSIGIFSHVGLVVFVFVTQPAFNNEKTIKCYILDTHMLLGLYLVKLEFFFILNFLRDLLIVIRDEITAAANMNLPSNLTASSVNITRFCDLYDDIVNQAEALNDCFGVGLGVVTVLTVINCFTTGYFYFVIQGSGLDWFLIMWLTSDLFQIWLVLTGAELFMKEIFLLVITIHKTMRVVNDPILIKQLKQFSLYLLHRKPHFTLCGMVPLDYTLLFTIASAVATYMVVLVQFQKTEGSTTFNITEFA